ncbi:MAG: winged helix-turn-helix domain-containing protein [Clostridia bacterium]|nr:winged helix-turn-helix domain-containing protein [Clostridia bacterium]
MLNRLVYLCESIIDKISKKKVISEKMISDLSLSIVDLIKNNESIELPKSFNIMAEKVDSYWFYSAFKDDNKEASFSYVRVYQIMNMYRVFVANNKYSEKVKEDSERFKRQYKLIKLIYENPSFRHQDLCKLLKISSDTLKKRIAIMIEQGYVYTSKVGKYEFYSLSNSGLDLLKILSGEEI